MNFKSIKKFLKKNYKKIIVVCLIMLLFSNKMYENFSTTDALDAVVATEKKVNDIFFSIDNDWARSKKGLYSQKEIKAKTIRSTEDVTAARNMTATGNVNAKKDVNAAFNVNVAGKVNAVGDIKGKRFCIGKTCIDEKHLQVLTGDKWFSIAGGRDHHTSNNRLVHSSANARFNTSKDNHETAMKIHAIRSHTHKK
jgi:predicted acyltransferase (DUF342 family)